MIRESLRHDPASPVWLAKQRLLQPPGPWPADWFGFPNIAAAFRELLAEARDNVPAPPSTLVITPELTASLFGTC